MGRIFNQQSQTKKRQELRNRAPYAERLLWTQLKGRQLAGVKFRRQYGVGPFVIDFYCPEFKLAIEVDGHSHESPEAKKHDAERQKAIEHYGIRFLRFTDEEALSDMG